MEKLNQIEDEAIDKLLRRYAKRPEGSTAVCEGFDPEVASLYIERVLTTTETARFEQHLSTCGPCRAGVVALSRLAQEDTAFATPKEAKVAAVAAPARFEGGVIDSRSERSASWLERVKALLLPLATPRFALAAI